MKNVLVDASVWVSHFRRPDPELVQLLLLDRVLVHPLVIGEIACGTPPDRHQTLQNLRSLRKAHQASLDETLGFMEQRRLYGRGCGLTDIALLASVKLSPAARLWTADKRLSALASELDVNHLPVH